MRLSKIFTKTSKDIAKEEVSRNAQLLIKAGLIDKLMSGVYSFLPLGYIVLKKIENIIREEMNKIDALELLLPALHPKEIWQVTGRWQYEEMFKLQNRKKQEFSLGWTHEEIIVPLVKKFANSYKDFPLAVYQIQTKFRDELRAKSGLLRGVEFIMKDLYSFHIDERDLDKYYERVKRAYFKIFQRCGLAKLTYLTLATGGTFSKYSHEFQTITDAGEDIIYICHQCDLAINKEIIAKEHFVCPECSNKNLEIKKSIEVGNIFKLKDKFTKPFNFFVKDSNDKDLPVIMGCYGIGLGRLLGTIVEIHNDDKGIIWPLEVAPFKVYLISVDTDKSNVRIMTEKLYERLLKQNIEVLYDDRQHKTIGEKLFDADLLGLPYRLIVSAKTLSKNAVELKLRRSKAIKLVSFSQVEKFLKS
ncbi:MAG: proline--tRNA ligase [Candidatus Parcubacteria bacterium]|nr:MAG: proline--tRNA ligase [Candidatus Parcubacteria bacterium]